MAARVQLQGKGWNVKSMKIEAIKVDKVVPNVVIYGEAG